MSATAMQRINIVSAETGEILKKIQMPVPLWNRLVRTAKKLGTTPVEALREAAREKIARHEAGLE